ncbi:MAG: hypothetical protein Q7R50_07880, partial [Dehalococcoidales bacterium]|nr:hypothetical protein [Dehalococcoidales bacterium]
MKRIIPLIVIFVFVAIVGLVGYSIGRFHNSGKPGISGPNTAPVTTAPANITVVSPNQNVNFDFAIVDI